MGQILFTVASATEEAEEFSGTFLMHVSASDEVHGVLLDESSVVVPASQRDFGDNGMSYVWRSAMLSDGRVVISGYDGNGPVVVKCYEAGQLITESWSTTIVGSALAYHSDVARLSNGNIVVTWIDNDDDVDYFSILDPDGGVVKAMTVGGNAGDASYDQESFVEPLDDGGFLLYWRAYSGSYTWASLWEADGTVRQAATRIDENQEWNNVTTQMPTAGGSYYGGMVVFWDAYNGSAFWYNTTDLGEEWSYELFYYGGDFMISAKLPQWTDRIATVYEYNGTIRGSIVTAGDDDPVEDYIIVSSMDSLNGFIALANNTFILQATSSSDEGMNYWILDTDLSVISGPVAAFTGLTGPASVQSYGGLPWTLKGASV